ncbi:DUF6708 domain-containing protein [Aquipseudomonas alcaligenes]|nr:DUF6708 domain-containing protein [Pseudomonas alcaligenes]
MPDNKYERLPQAGDFEQEAGTEVFYLSPKPIPTGMPAISAQHLHREASEVFLDFAAGKATIEFGTRASIGSVVAMIIFLLCVSGFGAWLRRHQEPFLPGWLDGFTNPFMWGFIGLLVVVAGYHMVRAIHQVSARPPVRFNRQRREVAFVPRKGEAPRYVPWEEVIACVTAGQTITQYAVTPSFALLIGLRDSGTGDVFWVTIPSASLGLAISEWEAIRTYMEEGPSTLPAQPEEYEEGTVAYFHLCRQVYRDEHSFIRYLFGFLGIQFFSGWTLPCHLSTWVNRRPKAMLPQEVLDWSQNLPTEQHARPSDALKQQSAEVRKALAKGQSLQDYFKAHSKEQLPLEA